MNRRTIAGLCIAFLLTGCTKSCWRVEGEWGEVKNPNPNLVSNCTCKNGNNINAHFHYQQSSVNRNMIGKRVTVVNGHCVYVSACGDNGVALSGGSTTFLLNGYTNSPGFIYEFTMYGPL